MTTPAQSISADRPARPVHGPRTPQAIGILAAALVIVVGSYAATALAPAGSPADGSEPAAGGSVGGGAPVGVPGDVAGLPMTSGSIARIDRSISIWTKNLAANPRDFISATNLAVLYHGRGRLSGDLGDHERALAAARTAIDIAPTSGPPRALEASILFTLHDFHGALTAAESLYRDDPAQLGALATMADAKLELGRRAEAGADLEALRLLAAGPAVDVRFARLAYLTGDPMEALRLAIGARDAATSAGSAGGSATGVGFYHYAVGEYARLAGDALTARAAYAAALAERPAYLGALIGLARIDAFEGRTADAIAGVERAVEIAPEPESLALLGDLLVASGDGPRAADAYATVRLVATLSELTGAVYDRQLLLFELDHGGATPELLDRAIAASDDRPDAAGLDLVAWANYRLGRYEDAKAASVAARASGIVDARILLHAGLIEIALGNRATGEDLVREALALGPALDPAERQAARE